MSIFRQFTLTRNAHSTILKPARVKHSPQGSGPDITKRSKGGSLVDLQRTILQAALWKRDITGLQIADDPAAVLSPIPVIISQVGAEDAVEQIIELLVSDASILRDVDSTLTPEVMWLFRRSGAFSMMGLTATYDLLALEKRVPAGTGKTER